jgi:hypothetical protein
VWDEHAHDVCVEHFLCQHQHQPMKAAAATRGHSEQEKHLEHYAFLLLWLVRFVLLTELSDLLWEDLPIVVCLGRGHNVRVVFHRHRLCQANGGALSLGTIARLAMSEDYT